MIAEKKDRHTKVFEGLLDLLDGQVDVDVGGNEGCVEPVVVVIAVYSVCSQVIVRQLLLQQTDDFHLWKISAVTHICHTHIHTPQKREESGWRHSKDNRRTYPLIHLIPRRGMEGLLVLWYSSKQK